MRLGRLADCGEQIMQFMRARGWRGPGYTVLIPLALASPAHSGPAFQIR